MNRVHMAVANGYVGQSADRCQCFSAEKRTAIWNEMRNQESKLYQVSPTSDRLATISKVYTR